MVYGKENNCNSGIAMFITRRLNAPDSGTVSRNTRNKAFWFIDIGILWYFGAVATVVQKPL